MAFKMIFHKHHLCLFLILFCSCFKGFAQLSKTHYIPPLTSALSNSSNPGSQYIYISTPSNTDVPFTIKPVGQPITNHTIGNVSNTNPRKFFLESSYGQLFASPNTTSTVFNDKGYIIEAEDLIYVSVRMVSANLAQAGALVSKGASALGTSFRVGAFTSESPMDNYLNFVSVMATEDNTSVTFSNLPAGLIIENYSGTLPINTNLNKGESYIVATNSLTNQSAGLMDGLIGCLVNSNKPIVVNCGSTNGSFHNGGGRDYGIDQIVGADKIGNEYIFVKGDGLDGWENVLIVAHSNNTSVYINGNPTPITTLSAGQYYLIEGNYYSSAGNMYVNTSQPVFAYQGVGATTNEANQGLFFVPPLSCEARGNLDNIAEIEDVANQSFTGGVTIVTKVGATVTINNQPVASTANAVTGNPNYVTYKVIGLSGNISVQSTDELYCAYFNQSGVATSGSFYSGFPSPPEINFDAQFATLGNCIPNITLEAANTENFDNYEWWFDDGSGFQIISSNIPSITPTIPGKYKLIGEITCTGEVLESTEVPVSICPDDIDNDGIIDNLDIDNDNDGIYNCNESRGDVTVNLNNLNNPVLEFEDSSTNSTITTGTYTTISSLGGTNTFVGDNIGDFISTVEAAANGEGSYSMTFTEPVNVKLLDRSYSQHIIIDGEYFVAKISPANKNITLVDPDDMILVDTNFDGVFEAGITQISGSEIHFKYNPAATGTTTPFEFFANQVSGFEFIHKLSNLNETSTFKGNISLTCFKNDHDGDGIKDDLDLDSDNDGIPDSVEFYMKIIPLSGIDADNNGFDDAYILGLNRLQNDSDNDGIPDFHDLDSDNDGIYDLVEADPTFSYLSDTDANGIADGPIGTNGWTDNAETAPDSNVLAYVPDNTDGDTIWPNTDVGSIIYSYIDLDSDGDGCSDVIEAGFSDGNGDDFLGDNPVIVDANGLVINATDGYTLPLPDYLTPANITITTQPQNTFACEASTTTITVDSPEAEFFQWEVSTDGVTWNTITDDATYSNSLTATLSITNIPLNFNAYQYRVKLDRNGNTCGIYSDGTTLTINPLPNVTNPSTYAQCDDESNDGQAYFNLTLDWIKEDINPNYIAEGLTFSYYLTQADAESASSPIPDPNNHQDTIGFTPEMVWIRVETPEGCFRTVPLTLVVNPYSGALATYNPASIYQCDDGMDNRDGVSTFDMTSIRDHISNVIFSTINVTVHFFETQIEADTETNEILDIVNHQNTNSPNAQNIWVRIKSDLGNDCLGLEEFPNLLIVESLPTANPVTFNPACDYDTSDAMLSYPFDTSNLENDLLSSQDPSTVTITYFDSNGNPLLYNDGTIVTSPIQHTFLSFNQTITVRVTNNSTNDPDGACYDETTIAFIVDEQPIANPVPQQIVCDGDAGDVDDDGKYPFDTSTFESTVRGPQTGMDIYFDYIDENGNPVSNSNSLPNPLLSGNQTITVNVINPINTNCTASTTIDLVVNPLPGFLINEEEIVCTSDPSFTVNLDPIISNPASFDYEWAFEGTVISNDKSIPVSEPGDYTITVTNPTTLCPRSETVSVKASELANITQSDLTIVDISENNSVTINNAEELGAGTYDFSLESKDGEIVFPFQDSPVFNNVRAGIYTLFVRDPICGTAELDIYVVGHRKFFTPNGDGWNDYWQIQGLSALQAGSSILIFDRYGKLVKQLDPFSQGWDGTLNGSRLPTDDYWFSVVLADGRSFKGHFTLKR